MMNVLRELRRRCKDDRTYDLLAGAIRRGARYRLTKAGIVLYGRRGTVHTHFSPSDWRAVRNLEASIKRAGL